MCFFKPHIQQPHKIYGNSNMRIWRSAKVSAGEIMNSFNPFYAADPFLIPPETRGLLMFSGGIKKDQWHEMG